MVMHSIKNIIKSQKRANTVDNPHKRDPDRYYARIWLSKKQYAVVIMIAKVQGISAQSAAVQLIQSAAQQYVGFQLRQEKKTEAMMKAGTLPYRRPGSFITVFREYLEEQGVQNPRLDNGYKLF
jgi:hypothetical protein